VGGKVSDADYKHWADALGKAMNTPGYAQLAAQHGLYPFKLSGAELETFVQKSSVDYRTLAAQLGLRTSPR
jgi:putative tricarboxylic transport membrane protein